MSNPIAWLRDDFTDNSTAPTWATSTTGSATVAETSSQVRFTLPSSTAGSHSAYYTSTGLYDLTGDSFFININTMVATGVAASAYFQLFADALNSYQWVQLSGTLKAQKVVAGVTTDLYSASWSSSTYKYLRIRESAGTVYFDSSTNGTSWTNRGSTTIASAFAVTDLKVQLGASCGNIASPGSFRLDDVNLILPALSSAWHWDQVEWPLLYRFRSITIAATSGQGYIATSNDGSTWRYFSGPLGSSSGGYNALVEYAAQADAQAMAVNLPTDGRWDLPTIVECRFIKLFHRSITGSSYTLREYYPRRLVQSDDVEAESIRAINIAAHTITADKLVAHTITATEIGTVSLDATATITAGGGNVILDDNGISILTGVAYDDRNTLKFYDPTGATLHATVNGFEDGTTNQVYIQAHTITGRDSAAYTLAQAPSGKNASAYLLAQKGLGGASVRARSDTSDNATVTITAVDGTTVSDGLNVGTSTGASTGQVRASNNVGVNDALSINGNVRIAAKGTGTGSSTYTFGSYDSASTVLFYVRDDGGVLLSKSGGLIGFYGTTPASKQTVTGSRGGNAALASLLTALANIGLITNSSSA